MYMISSLPGKMNETEMIVGKFENSPLIKGA